jgi:type I restriction enzyme S subunit
MQILSDVAVFVTEHISSRDIALTEYVTTDSLLQNKQGRTKANNLPPKECTLTKFKRGDILIGNIRPYLKKIWKADGNGGCSTDVLVFRAKDNHDSSFLYALLAQDAFYNYAMKGVKGSKMPRGDKAQIMRFPIPSFTCAQEENIGKLIANIESKIALNRAINRNLPTPDHSSGGAEVHHVA